MRTSNPVEIVRQDGRLIETLLLIHDAIVKVGFIDTQRTRKLSITVIHTNAGTNMNEYDNA